MMALTCPHAGLLLLGHEDLLALVNVEPGVIVLHWRCLCGAEHFSATGAIGSVDRERARTAVALVRERLRAPRATEVRESVSARSAH